LRTLHEILFKVCRENSDTVKREREFRNKKPDRNVQHIAFIQRGQIRVSQILENGRENIEYIVR
jgi:hypothetical protein